MKRFAFLSTLAAKAFGFQASVTQIAPTQIALPKGTLPQILLVTPQGTLEPVTIGANLVLTSTGSVHVLSGSGNATAAPLQIMTIEPNNLSWRATSIPANARVYRNGLLMHPGRDYTLNGTVVIPSAVQGMLTTDTWTVG